MKVMNSTIIRTKDSNNKTSTHHTANPNALNPFEFWKRDDIDEATKCNTMFRRYASLSEDVEITPEMFNIYNNALHCTAMYGNLSTDEVANYLLNYKRKN